MALSSDNRSAIDLPENYRISELSKDNDIHYHGIGEIVYDIILTLMYI
jgi:hypothetical protein